MVVWRLQSVRDQHRFTLLEMLAATAMFAVVLAALLSVFHGTLRMRERSCARIDGGLAREEIVSGLQRDLLGVVPPTGVLAGAFVGEKVEAGAVRLDQVRFRTSIGPLGEDEPWGDVVEVSYLLEASARGEGHDLIRASRRNLLAAVAEDPEGDVLAGAVGSFEINYLDAETWVDSWDSTTRENELPRALRLRIDFLPLAGVTPPPVELIAEIVTQPRTGASAGEGGSSPGTGPAAAGGGG